MINSHTFIGEPQNFKGICKIYPPKVRDVVALDSFPRYQTLFTLSQEELHDELIRQRVDTSQFSDFTPFVYLLNNYYNDKEFANIVNESFDFFIHEPVIVLPEKKIIIVGYSEDTINPDKDLINPRILNEENYFNFQNAIRESLGMDSIEPPQGDEDPRIARIKAKARYRDKVKAKEGKNLATGTILAAICCMGVGLTPLNIGEISYASLSWLVQMNQQREEYDLTCRSMMLGAKNTDMEYWIRNLE